MRETVVTDIAQDAGSAEMSDNYDWLYSAEEIGVDIESYDPRLRDLGPGVYRKDGHVCGVSLAVKDKAVYLDVKHPDTTPERAERHWKIIADVLSRPTTKVGANILYDLDWLCNGNGLTVGGRCEDVQFAEPLLNEYRTSYSLGALSKLYGVQEKASDLLKRYCDEQGWYYKDPREHIWKMPASVVARYAELDGMLPMQIMEKQRLEMDRQGLNEIYNVEIGLIPLLLRMRKIGARLDTEKLKRTSLAVADKLYELSNDIYEWAGGEFNISSTTQLALHFDAHGIEYPRKAPTELMKRKGKRGNPNLDKEVLTRLHKERALTICDKILKWRHYNTLTNMFLLPYYEYLVGDRIHCTFNALRSDDYGAVSGRFSSSKPNLQQVSAQSDDEYSDGGNELLEGQLLRKLFIPEDGCLWGKLDYSQVEYRIAAHYAIGEGADELRAAYVNNPDTDYHQHIQDQTGFDRRTAKRLNFGASYGMGYRTAARKFYWSLEEAEMFMAAYHKAAPYLKTTRSIVVEKAERRGFVFTLLGRRARTSPTRKLHSLYNRLIQGTAADIMKKGMVDAWNKGLFEVLPPHITVHDEIDVSVPQTPEGQEALAELKNTMETCVKLKVPLRVDCHTAINWAEAD